MTLTVDQMKDNKNLYFQGRILWKDRMAIFGYTNCSLTVHFRGTKLSAVLRTGENDWINAPAVRVYVDGKTVAEHVLGNVVQEIVLHESAEPEEHTIRVVKFTEAGISAGDQDTIDLALQDNSHGTDVFCNIIAKCFPYQSGIVVTVQNSHIHLISV